MVRTEPLEDSDILVTCPCPTDPNSPGAGHSSKASSARPRLLMAAGSMLRAGLGEARGLRVGVFWGAGLAGRSLGQETQPLAEAQGPSPFLASG